MKLIGFFRDNRFGDVINGMSTEINIEKRKNYENKLMVIAIAPMIIMASLISLFLGYVWQIETYKIIGLATTLFIAGNALILIVQTSLSEKIKLHILSFIMTTAVLTTYAFYYREMKVLFWFIIIILLLTGILSHSTTIFFYLGAFTIFVLTYSASNSSGSNVVIRMDYVFYLTLAIMFICIMVMVFLINRFYVYIVETLSGQYSRAVEDNEVITGLYEEITASEEELREQNDKMSELNQQLLINEGELKKRNEEVTGLYDQLLASEEELREQNDKLTDVNTELLKHQKRLNFLAYKDTLTGLPNRKMILEQLDILANIQGDSNDKFSLVFIDLDNFKNINDTMGHTVGDELLIQMANRMTNHINKIDLLGRLGGDEFALLVRRHISEESLMAYVQQVQDCLTPPFKLANYEINSSASFGVALWPDDGRTAEELLTAADTAMYKAKEGGKNDVQFFRESMKQEIMDRIDMEYHLLKALENKEFFLEYQPLIDVVTKEPIGFEALLRWQSSKYGRVAPLKFIPLAEDLGLIYEIGKRVFTEVCNMVNKMKECCDSDKIFTVNVSPLQFKNPLFLEDLKKIVEETGVDTHCLELEITETVFIDDVKKTCTILEAIKEMGIMIAVDDFGTGYSSLSYILGLPIDTLKIDKSFIDKIDSANPKRNIVGSIISLAHSLEMKVVAEGVENALQVSYLEKNACDIIQGYYFSKPVSEADARAFVKH